MLYIRFVQAAYPKTLPQVIIKCDRMHPSDKASLCTHMLSEAGSLVGKPMLETLIHKANVWLEEKNIDMKWVQDTQEHKTSPKTRRKKKERTRRTKNKKSEDEEELVGKLPSMKTAGDVISRIWWDDKLERDCFVVGYLDRFLGVVENAFTAFSWEDIASVDYNTLAIPQHRIHYFKYKDVKVWDKNDRTDNMFGSTGSGVTISDVIRQYQPAPQEEGAKVATTDDEDEDDNDDDIVIKTGHEEEEDNLNPREKYWGKKVRPTHFLALRITNPAVQAAVAAVQRDILDMEPGYAESIIPPGRLHMTLCCLGLDTEQDVLSATHKLQQLKPTFAAWQPHEMEIELEDVGHFYHNCLYAKVKPHSTFMEYVHFVRKEVQQCGLECRDVFDFVPHMTILKLMRQQFQENRTRYFDARIYTSYAGTKFGSHCVDNIYLCSMSGSKQEDGFYESPTSLLFP